MLEENPCAFETYDIDRDGLISKEELESIFGVQKETKDLFAFIHTGDGL
jgi:Ca2+-binding EF-hand superfamily protein